MTAKDFRHERHKLPSNSFAIRPQKEPKPTDLVDRETWRKLVCLTDDVSLRTSEHHGTLLRHANQFLDYWIALVLDLQSLPDHREDALAIACIDAHDDFQASIYTMLTGFYSQSIASLRTVMESMLTGAYFGAFPDSCKFKLWVEGHREGQVWVKKIRNHLKKHEPYMKFEKGKYPFLGKGGWVQSLYGFLGGVSHGRPLHMDEEGRQIPTSNVGLWGKSNGPIYEPCSVQIWSK